MLLFVCYQILQLLNLVELMLDEVLPWEGEFSHMKILDPSCGSGVFLVEAYRRLIARWNANKKQQYIKGCDLIELLCNSISHKDINETFKVSGAIDSWRTR